MAKGDGLGLKIAFRYMLLLLIFAEDSRPRNPKQYTNAHLYNIPQNAFDSKAKGISTHLIN